MNRRPGARRHDQAAVRGADEGYDGALKGNAVYFEHVGRQIGSVRR